MSERVWERVFCQGVDCAIRKYDTGMLLWPAMRKCNPLELELLTLLNVSSVFHAPTPRHPHQIDSNPVSQSL
jgi:hypothetical protein